MHKPLSVVQRLQHPLFKKYNVHVEVKRDDLIHNIISGNKWRKLKYNLQHLSTGKYNGALTFGGSYSNHIHAFAFACYQQNIPCAGIIRGEQRYTDNFTLRWARHWGMQCHFVDRKTYRRRFESDFIEELKKHYPGFFVIPEGGSNALAIKGVSEVITELEQQSTFDTLMTPVGSGGTIAGLIAGDSLHSSNSHLANINVKLERQEISQKSKNNPHRILGIAVLKQAEYLIDEIRSLLPEYAKTHSQWQLLTNFHRGGYGKFNEIDISRLVAFNQECNITFEPVYSGKMILALIDLLEQGYFNAGERIVLLHTGGIQGIGGMLEQGRLKTDNWPTLLKAPCT